MQHKEAVVKTLQIRASFLSSCPWLGTDEWDHVLNDLKVNSYPGSVLKKCLDNKTKPEVSSVCIVSQRRFIVSRRRFIVSQRSFLCVSQKIGTILKSELVQTTPVKRFSTEMRLIFWQMYFSAHHSQLLTSHFVCHWYGSQKICERLQIFIANHIWKIGYICISCWQSLRPVLTCGKDGLRETTRGPLKCY